MSERGSPMVRRRRLGRELRRLRERLDLTGDQVAARLSWSPSKVSRIETSKTVPRKADVEALLTVYEADEDKRRELLQLHRDANRKGWWQEYEETLPEDLTTFLGLEAEAVVGRSWEPQLVPGLLQTEPYAREVLQAVQPVARQPGEWREARLEARMTRQRLLLRSADPLAARFVVDESVLLRRFGGADVMRGQIERLIEVSELPNVELRILLLDAPSHPVNTGSFVHLTFNDFPDVVYLESLFGARFVEDPNLVYGYEVAFGYLERDALGPRSTRELLEKRLQDWR